MDEFRINRLVSGTWFTVDRKLAAENYREWWWSTKWSEIFSIIWSWFNVIIGAADYGKHQHSHSCEKKCRIPTVHVK